MDHKILYIDAPTFKFSGAPSSYSPPYPNYKKHHQITHIYYFDWLHTMIWNKNYKLTAWSLLLDFKTFVSELLISFSTLCRQFTARLEESSFISEKKIMNILSHFNFLKIVLAPIPQSPPHWVILGRRQGTLLYKLVKNWWPFLRILPHPSTLEKCVSPLKVWCLMLVAPLNISNHFLWF